MIQLAHVTFEQAKWLKEIGFDVKTRGRIHVSHWHLVKDNIIPSNVNTSHNDMFAPIDNWNKNNTHYMSLPEQWQVIEWLRVNHGLFVYCQPSYSLRVFYCEIQNIKTLELIHSTGVCSTPQDAYSIAFNYIKDNNLIKKI